FMTNKRYAKSIKFDDDTLLDNNFSKLLLSLDNKIHSGEFKVTVYGLGHVGSPIAAAWLRAGASVIGVDKSKLILHNAREGKTHIPEPGVSDAYENGLNNKKFFVYDDLIKASQDSFLKMVCVPVLAADGTAELTAVKNVATAIGKGLKKNDVVTLNPSVPPGTTEDVIIPILQKQSHLTVEDDFYMIYNPERIYEGRAIEDIEERYPGIISGYGKKSLEIGTKIFSLIYKKGIISMSSIKSAETEKLFEGVYRDVNIALSNELAIFSERLGINFWEARHAANSQPFCNIHKPGIGVGGACIPVYPQFILKTAKVLHVDCNLTKYSRLLNNSMPKYCVRQALRLIQPKKIRNSTITLLGLAFRGGVSDTRLSPTYDVIKELQKLKVKEIRIHDPLVKKDDFISNYINTFLFNELSEAIKGADLIMVIADHEEYKKLNYESLKNIALYDGRGIINIDKIILDKYSSIGNIQ
ncbi:MAG TPA: nucleotide sugar dehydrogenase, partial [Nitrososphaeraceae archaeon]|nr:nucleotide sugar dehydrogenase [Nitrososphaeraceae archaeon]